MSTILVIDDEKMTVKMLQMALEAYGHQVEVAASGEEGIKKFNTARFDLVITDMMMPGLDGRGVVRYIRQSPRSRTPVIGISGTPWLLEKVDVDSILPKPFSIVSLVQSIQELAPLKASRAIRSASL
ncbi:MAG: response regulator [Deltaproteobacteria bacterium]|nr:response regulator [Deltaproteobacteria bacterium]MBW2131112.1 response regulator [Deltaproteobacteria bacterium]